MSQSAIVIATFSRRMQLRLQDSSVVQARIRGKRLKPVCGDRVQAEPIDGEDDWLISAIEQRDNELSRPNARGQSEVLAANLELLIVVAAVSPPADWFIVDRYLCAAETMRIPAVLVYNKTDILQSEQPTSDVLAEFTALAYPVVRCSAKNNTGTDALRQQIGGKTAIMVGQSGVGKSSLINELAEDAVQKTSAISDKTGEGRHTTVNSVLLSLPGGGAVIDSPGVRDYAPALHTISEVQRGFREIHEHGHDCRFSNCRHLQEPGCAVKAAVDDERISPRRYESYRRSLRLAEKLSAVQ